MARSSRGVRFLAVLVALGLMLFSVGFSYAVADDYSRRDVLPRGAVIGGVDVGGLSRARAVELLRREVEEPLLKPLTADARGKRLTLDPRPLVAIDVEAMVDRALAPRARTTLVQRIYYRVTNADVGVTLPAEVRLDSKGLRAWTAKSAKQVYEKAVDSKLSVDGDSVRISKSAVGWRLDESATVAALQQALMTDARDVKLPMREVKPKVTEAAFPRTLLVHLDQRRVRLFAGEKFVKSWPIAIGQPAYPTPQGWWNIEAIEYNPSWTNPAPSGWGAGMPAYIPPGPGNPLGTLAIRTTAPGIAFHGTQDDGSIGEAASHGCMRMHESDVHDLAPRVKAGDRVIIVP